MAWTSPPAFSDGVQVSAADLNPYVRNNLRYLKGLDGAVTFENAIELTENIGNATPASGLVRLYAKTDGRVYSKDDAGTEYDVSKRIIGARVYNNAAITLTTGVPAALTFNTERFDSGSIHSTSVNTSRLTLPVAGSYLVTGHGSFVSNATGVRNLDIRLNGATVIASQLLPAASGIITTVSISTIYQFAANDYIELVAFQNSGGNLDINTAGNYSPEFAVYRLGD